MAIGARDVLDDRFVVEKPVASGGMGVIFRGLDQQTGSLVGIKTMRVSGEADRFEREIKILAALKHPGIVTYLGHGRVAQELYLVMEWLEGEDLGARLEAGEVDVQEALSIGIQVADALGAAHRQGIVHRDVKPANVFLTDWRLDRVKLLDYGIARRGGMETLTGTGFVLGTPAYMAPEQANGQRDIDARADVYALGALLFRCIAGRPPFEGDTLNELLAAALHRAAPALGQFAAVGPELEALVAQMLDKDPDRRPADGFAARAALQSIDASSKGFGATLQSTPRGSVAPSPPRGLPSGEMNLATGARAAGLSSVAVLSFLDMSPSKDQDYLCDGIAEELINTLAQLPGLRVSARSSSFQFKSSSADARAIGTRLGVDAILEGGVRKSADRLRVTVQLVDVQDGSPRWSHRFDGKLDDVFDIQDQIASSVATAMRGILSVQERDALRRPGTTAEAYEHFLKGRQLFNELTLIASIDAAEREFRRAIELDPLYAPAYAGLAQVYGWSVGWLGRGEEVRAAADKASRQALELGPHLLETRLARAAVLAMNADYESAEREYREAVRMSPNSFEALYPFARACFQMGKFAESVELFRRAGDIRPEDFQSILLSELPLRRLGRFEEAAQALRDGIRRAERQLEVEPNNARAWILGACSLASAGERARALEWTNRALSIAPEDPAVLLNTACTYARLGMKEEAFAYLDKTFGKGVGLLDWVKHDPDYDILRDDPRFQALVSRLS